MNTSYSRSPRAGFTLVELLVVIGIISVLISILLPSLNKARSTARKIACQSNLRQMGLATTFYTNDNKGFFPMPDYGGLAMGADDPMCWWNAVPNNLGFEPLGGAGTFPDLIGSDSGAVPVLHCPSANLSPVFSRTYAMNQALNQGELKYWGGGAWSLLTGGALPVKYTLYRNRPMIGRDGSYWGPEDVPMYMDGWLIQNFFGNAVYEQWRSVRDQATYADRNARESNRPHENGMNVIFIDSHVEYAGPKHKLFTAPAPGATTPKGGAFITDDSGTKNLGHVW